jgi:hypothetical protein
MNVALSPEALSVPPLKLKPAIAEALVTELTIKLPPFRFTVL